MKTKRNSIVLDIDGSIRLGNCYWSVVQEKTEIYWKHAKSHDSNASPPLLGSSLLYYLNNPEIITNQSELLDTAITLEKHQENMVYDYRQISRLVDSGFDVPTNVSILRSKIDTTLIGEAIELIRSVWPIAYEEIKIYLSGFVLFESDRILSLTTPSWFGAVFLSTKILRMNSILEVATAIIHEIGHMVLFADSAVNSPLNDLKENFYSPLVNKDRPALMVIHAQMAMARILIWLHQVQAALVSDTSGIVSCKVSTSELEREISKYTRCYIETMPSVRRLSLTEHGRSILENFEQINSLINPSNEIYKN